MKPGLHNMWPTTVLVETVDVTEAVQVILSTCDLVNPPSDFQNFDILRDIPGLATFRDSVVIPAFSTYIKEKLGGKHRRMPKEWLEPIFEQAKKIGVTEMIPSTMGEPLIYKHFAHFVELCYKYNIQMNLTTPIGNSQKYLCYLGFQPMCY